MKISGEVVNGGLAFRPSGKAPFTALKQEHPIKILYRRALAAHNIYHLVTCRFNGGICKVPRITSIFFTKHQHNQADADVLQRR